MFKEIYQAYINFFYQHTHRGVAIFILFWWVQAITHSFNICLTLFRVPILGHPMDVNQCMYYWTFFYIMGAFAELLVESLSEKEEK